MNEDSSIQPPATEEFLLHQVQLGSLWLHSLQTKRIDEIPEDFEPSLEMQGRLLDWDDKAAESEMRVGVRAVDEDRKFGFDVQVLMRARFQSDTALGQRHWEEFAQLQAVFLFWPYVRELISNLTNRMGLPPFTLPLLQIPGSTPPTEEEAG